MSKRVAAHLRGNVAAYLIAFLAVTVVPAFAAEGQRSSGHDPGAASAPSGPAGGDLDGTYPAPVIRKLAVSTPTLANAAVTSPKLADAAVTIPKLAFNPATQAELNGALGGVWRLGGNANTDPASDLLGTKDDTSLALGVDGTPALRLEPAPDGGRPAPNVVAGSPDNRASAGVQGGTIAGGARLSAGDPATANRVTDDRGTIGGGSDNQAGNGTLLGNTDDAEHATVGGGRGNEARGQDATIAGGSTNSANARAATVGGGGLNFAGGINSTVAGGSANQAEGAAATVMGGFFNVAKGDGSLVGGTRALNQDPAHEGVFMFSDKSTQNTFPSTAANEFAVRASGGFRLRTKPDLSTGCNLPAGSGTFACTSDRATKEGFAPVDPERVLDRVASLPVATWRYRGEADSVRHMGPTSQAFADAFGLGSDRRSIGLPDANGVALAAIKGLKAEVDSLRAEVGGGASPADASGSGVGPGGAAGSGLGALVVAAIALLSAALAAALTAAIAVRRRSPALG